jgi:hypothetical protein
MVEADTPKPRLVIHTFPANSSYDLQREIVESARTTHLTREGPNVKFIIYQS